MSFKNNKKIYKNTFRSGHESDEADSDIDVSSRYEPRESLVDKIDMLVRRNFAVPNIYKGEGKQGKKRISTIEALKENVSPTRLYHLAKESCRGTMHKIDSMHSKGMN
ncbi:hypothetical protein DMUE_1468 [Dictyocoela muelleri]|nr:hypothetical protein DMUE_1468 [Dictyocoela muelleri]